MSSENEKTIRVITFSGKEEEYKYWAEKFMARTKKTRAKANASEESDEPVPWAKSEAKKVSKDGIVSGMIPNPVEAEEVCEMCDSFKRCQIENFETNLKNLGVCIPPTLKLAFPPKNIWSVHCPQTDNRGRVCQSLVTIKYLEGQRPLCNFRLWQK